MTQGYNFYNLGALFKEFLTAGNKNLQPVTVKNYLSDLRHFSGWFILKLKTDNPQLSEESTDIKIIVSFITPDLIRDYKSYLSENNIPQKTINRRLSTLRKFCTFCILQGWLNENPAKQIENISSESVSIESTLRLYEHKLVSEHKNKDSVDNEILVIRELLSI